MFRTRFGILASSGGAELLSFSFVSASDDSISFDVNTQVPNPLDISLSPDGTHLYVNREETPPRVYQYDLSTPNDITTAVFVNSIATSPGGSPNTQQVAMWFKPDGTKLYLADTNVTIFQYTLSTAWDITTATDDGVNFVIASNQIASLQLTTDGTTLFLALSNTNEFKKYTLSTPWDISTASAAGNSYDFTGEFSFITSGVISKTGTRMALLSLLDGFSSEFIYDYTLSTPWDLTTASLVTSFELGYGGLLDPNVKSMEFRDDEQKVFIMVDNASDDFIRQFSCPGS